MRQNKPGEARAVVIAPRHVSAPHLAIVVVSRDLTGNISQKTIRAAFFLPRSPPGLHSYKGHLSHLLAMKLVDPAKSPSAPSVLVAAQHYRVRPNPSFGSW